MHARYRPLSIAIHWVMAVLILAQLTLGWWMIGLPKSPPGLRAGWFNVHKSVGIMLALLLVLRIVQRLRHEPPPLPWSLPSWQRALASVTHGALYVVLAALPITGFIGSLVSGYPIKFLGYRLPLPVLDIPALKQFTSAAHYTLVWAMMGVLGLHIAGALQHLLHRDGVFSRMWPGAR